MSVGIVYEPVDVWIVVVFQVRTEGAVWITPEITWVEESTRFFDESLRAKRTVSPTRRPSGPAMRGLISFTHSVPLAIVPLDGMMLGKPSPSGSHDLKTHSSIIRSYALALPASFSGQPVGEAESLVGFFAMTDEPQRAE